MTEADSVEVTRSFVTGITVRVRTNNRVFDVEHGPDDLNIPDESFPLRVRAVDAPDDGWLPASALTGTGSVFASANAYIKKFSRRTVPSYALGGTAATISNASGHAAEVRVETASGGTYRLTFDTTDVEIPLVEGTYTPAEGEKKPLHLGEIPEAVIGTGREEVELTVDI